MQRLIAAMICAATFAMADSIRNLDPSTIAVLPRLPGVHNATWENSHDELVAAGWRKLDEGYRPSPDPGYVTLTEVYVQDATRDDYAVPAHVYALAAEPAESTPQRFPHGIDTSALVLDTVTNHSGAAYVAADDGSLVFAGFWHASPYKIATEREAMTAAAIAKHNVRKQTLAMERQNSNTARAAAAAANSVPALRQQVAELARIVALLCADATNTVGVTP